MMNIEALVTLCFISQELNAMFLVDPGPSSLPYAALGDTLFGTAIL